MVIRLHAVLGCEDEVAAQPGRASSPRGIASPGSSPGAASITWAGSCARSCPRSDPVVRRLVHDAAEERLQQLAALGDREEEERVVPHLHEELGVDLIVRQVRVGVRLLGRPRLSRKPREPRIVLFDGKTWKLKRGRAPPRRASSSALRARRIKQPTMVLFAEPFWAVEVEDEPVRAPSRRKLESDRWISLHFCVLTDERAARQAFFGLFGIAAPDLSHGIDRRGSSG